MSALMPAHTTQITQGCCELVRTISRHETGTMRLLMRMRSKSLTEYLASTRQNVNSAVPPRRRPGGGRARQRLGALASGVLAQTDDRSLAQEGSWAADLGSPVQQGQNSACRNTRVSVAYRKCRICQSTLRVLRK